MERKKKPKKADNHPEQEEQIIASEEINNGPEHSAESNEFEAKPEAQLPEQDETTSRENDPSRTHQNEPLNDVHELVAPENNGMEEKQDAMTNESQEIISVGENSFGEESNDSPKDTGTLPHDFQETGFVESNELKSKKTDKPSESEITSSEKLPAPEPPADKAPHEEKNNSAYISSQVDKLLRLKDEKNFVDFWFYVKELNKMIFTLRGLQKEERLKFKERIGELCEETKKVQDELKTKIAKTSHLKLERIQQILDEALGFGVTHEELEKSFHKIEEANKFLREGKVQGEDGEESADMSRDHREQAKELIKGAKDKIFDRKREIREGNFKKVTDRLNSISDSLLSQGRAQRIFEGIKNLRNEMRSMNLDRSQLREIDNVIDTLWKKAREKASSGRTLETKKKIYGLEDLARRKEIFIKTLDKEIKDLNVKWSSVQNDFFKNRVNEWIEEKKQKILDTQKEIESVHEKIKFLQEQLQRN